MTLACINALPLEQITPIPTWHPSTSYAPDNRVVTPQTPCIYKCLAGGTSGAVNPLFHALGNWPQFIGDTVTDGSVVWLAEQCNLPVFSTRVPHWTPLRSVAIGDLGRPLTYMRHPDPTMPPIVVPATFYSRSIAAGFTSTIEPLWPIVIDGSTVSDGSAAWVMVDADPGDQTIARQVTSWSSPILTAWSAGLSVSAGAFVRPTAIPLGIYARCTSSGVTGGTEPNWGNVGGVTLTDGSAGFVTINSNDIWVQPGLNPAR